ncbi:Armadillo repeat only 4 [Tripterygium wilfordii]|uniref:Armadillo repeat only 4 n=1 Tax=Tripterygium wilfordii TaxID=458696 RepID=A0A7J7D425_TRIWF|nr:Armadillo repeat only 4 [Tripterygium wilfordii]
MTVVQVCNRYVRKCKRRNIFRRLLSISNAGDFRRLINLLDSSIGDMRWLLRIFDYEGSRGGILSLPPIASDDPILAWVWSFIATIYMAELPEIIEAVNEIAALVQDNDRNKKIFVEEGGVTPLLKMIKDRTTTEAQIAAMRALYMLCNNEERVRVVVNESGIEIVVQILVLLVSPIRAQIQAAKLVARMAEHDPIAREEFGRENAIRPLMNYLALDMFGTGRIDYSNRPGNSGKEKENASPELKMELKFACSEAVRMLARGSVSNGRMISESYGLSYLAKLVEKEHGELQVNCLMTIMEIAVVAEFDTDLRRAAFKTSSPDAKAVVDQLLRLIESSDNPALQIPAIKAIGSLARTFPAKEIRIISPLVAQLENGNQDVAAEATISLQKFASPDNFLHAEHSKTIVGFGAIPTLIRLLRNNPRIRFHGSVLLCYLALHVCDHKALEKARVLTALQGAEHTLVAQHPELRELLSQAIYQLTLYHTWNNSYRQSYVGLDG